MPPDPLIDDLLIVHLIVRRTRPRGAVALGRIVGRRLLEAGLVRLLVVRLIVAGLVMVGPGLMHGRLGMRLGRLVIDRGLGLVMRGLMDRRGMMRLGRRCGLIVVMLGRRRRRRLVMRLMVMGRRRRGVMVTRVVVVDHNDFIGRNDASNKGYGHHTGDTGGNETHRASFIMLSLS